MNSYLLASLIVVVTLLSPACERHDQRDSQPGSVQEPGTSNADDTVFPDRSRAPDDTNPDHNEAKPAPEEEGANALDTPKPPEIRLETRATLFHRQDGVDISVQPSSGYSMLIKANGEMVLPGIKADPNAFSMPGHVTGTVRAVETGEVIASYSFRVLRILPGKTERLSDCYLVCQGSYWLAAVPEIEGTDWAFVPPTVAEYYVPESGYGVMFRSIDVEGTASAQGLVFSGTMAPLFLGPGSDLRAVKGKGGARSSVPKIEKKSCDSVVAVLFRAHSNLSTLVDSFPAEWACSLSKVQSQSPGHLEMRLAFGRSDINDYYRATKLLFAQLKLGGPVDLNGFPSELQSTLLGGGGYLLECVAQVLTSAFGCVADCHPPIERYMVSILDSKGQKIGSVSISREDLSALKDGVTPADGQRVGAIYVFE
ncbi:MAG: hypothetical protein V2A79_07175 [Planctomycetota bacterium]